MKSMMLIVNPKAGRMHSRNRLHNLVRQFNQNDYQCHLFVTNRSGDVKQMLEVYGQNYQLIVALGGDGTLNEVITTMINSKISIPLGFIPGGTTNDFARSHQIPINFKNATQKIMTGSITKIDIGAFNHRYFNYIATFGAYTAVAYQTNQTLKNWLGYPAYLVSSFKHLNSLRKYSITLTINGQTTSEDVIFLAITNSTSVGGLLRYPQDQIQLDDGYLEICILRYPTKPTEWISLTQALATGQYTHPLITLTKASTFKIVSEEVIDWCLDGEYGGQAKSVDIHCLPQQIQLIK
jgi:diacylglycerol kinase (ATP)